MVVCMCLSFVLHTYDICVNSVSLWLLLYLVSCMCMLIIVIYVLISCLLSCKMIGWTIIQIFFYMTIYDIMHIVIDWDYEHGIILRFDRELRKYRKAIKWIMNDIKGISPSIVQHRIHLNDDATPRRDPQRRLNPLM